MHEPDMDRQLLWRTELGNGDPARKLVCGYPLEDLAGGVPFTDTLHLVLRRELPSPAESMLLNACLTSIVDHGFRNTIAVGARFIASANPDPIAATCAGLLGIGRHTAGAQSFVVRMLARDDPERAVADVAEEIVGAFQRAGERLPGFGTKLHTVTGYDARARRLREIFDGSALSERRPHALFHAVHRALEASLGRAIVINIDGEMGAVFASLGYSPREVQFLEIAAMLPSVIGHAAEEIRDGSPMRNVPRESTRYVGHARRPVLPAERAGA